MSDQCGSQVQIGLAGSDNSFTPRADLVAGDVGGSHAEAEHPQDLPARDHCQQPSDIGGEVQELRIGDGPDEATPGKRHQHGRQERSGAGPEEPVIEAEHHRHRGERRSAEAGVAIRLPHRRGEQEIHRHQDEQDRHEGGEEARIDMLDGEGTRRRPQECARRRHREAPQVEMPAAPIGDAGRGGFRMRSAACWWRSPRRGARLPPSAREWSAARLPPPSRRSCLRRRRWRGGRR
ncbi:hypothetical protein DdX_21192 [Ditylenchus destructor]|uniref:Uncharacterized protein n=1 Tax=Ditylenchus destructor TaxID=166010 RepID=A0AAD4MK21_9BILA|nr:hypothetical protein DdX_21192 [Ditylenchus destructor]